MKNSKYGNTRIAVGRIQNADNTERIGGFSYVHPGKKGERVDIDKRTWNKSKNFKIIYNIFSPVQIGTKPTEPDREPKKFATA
ncbi:MAG: hypothetical protein IKI15_00330 [Lachnospiraceae bacterium]|nr:hypothetical protein [Lachnospiraceae bacterium]